MAKKETDWRTRNRARYNERNRKYMKEYRKRYFALHPEKRPFSKPWARANLEKYLFLTIQRRAPQKKLKAKRTDHRYKLRLTYAEFLAEIGGKAPIQCPVLGIKLYISDDHRSDNLPTVDRIDNSRPYEKGNIAVISRRANILKNGGTADEHRRIADWMLEKGAT